MHFFHRIAQSRGTRVCKNMQFTRNCIHEQHIETQLVSSFPTKGSVDVGRDFRDQRQLQQECNFWSVDTSIQICDVAASRCFTDSQSNPLFSLETWYSNFLHQFIRTKVGHRRQADTMSSWFMNANPWNLHPNCQNQMLHHQRMKNTAQSVKIHLCFNSNNNVVDVCRSLRSNSHPQHMDSADNYNNPMRTCQSPNNSARSARAEFVICNQCEESIVTLWPWTRWLRPAHRRLQQTHRRCFLVHFNRNLIRLCAQCIQISYIVLVACVMMIVSEHE